MATLSDVLATIDGDEDYDRYCYQAFNGEATVSDARPFTDNEYRYQVDCTVPSRAYGTTTVSAFVDSEKQITDFLFRHCVESFLRDEWEISNVRHYAELQECD